MSEIKVFCSFRRKPGTSLADFSHYWITVHAELAKRLLQIRRYVQDVRLEDKPTALGAPLRETWCDGCAELWFDDASAIDEMAALPNFAESMEDEARFMDLAIPRDYMKTEEHVLDTEAFDTRLRGVKVLVFVRRPANTDRSAFLSSWGGDEAVKLGRALGVTRHVACANVEAADEVAHPNTGEGQAEGEARGDVSYDAVRELWWRDLEAVRTAAVRQPDIWDELVCPRIIDAPRSFALVAHERIIIP